MQVKIVDYGLSKASRQYYITYKVTGLNTDDQKMLQAEVEGNVELKGGQTIITNYYGQNHYPFGSQAAHHRLKDFIANEEIEMTVYLASILEDEFLQDKDQLKK